MSDFRYPQFCALARAAELLCQRWNLLIIRELLFGPRRFVDLRRGLGGVSPSVLSERLACLEAARVVRKSELEPPASCTVYELADAGAALMPAMRELGRWGARFLMPPQEGETPAASFLGGYLRMLARDTPTPPLRLNLRTSDENGEYRFHVRGGRSGTTVLDGREDADAEVGGEAIDLLAVAGGFRPAERAIQEGRLHVSGDAESVLGMPQLFRSYFPIEEEGEHPCGSSRSKRFQPPTTKGEDR